MTDGRVRLALGLVASATVTSGCGLFSLDSAPAEVEQMFGGMGMGPGCTAIARKAERVARAELPQGGTAELWIAPTLDGGQMEVTIEHDAQGNTMGGGGTGCGGPEPDENGMSFSGGGDTQFADGSGWVSYSGRATADAAQVRLTFDDTDPVIVDTGAIGYFLVYVAVESGSDWMEGNWPTKVEALDDDGEVIATFTP